MRDALSLTDQAIAFGSGQLQEAAVRQMLGSVDRSVVFSLIEALAQADGRAVVEQVDQLRAAGLSAATTLEDMAGVLQRMAVLQAVPAMAVDEPTAMLCASPNWPRGCRPTTQLLYSLCLHGRAELGLAPDEYVGLTMVLLRLLPFKAGPAASAAAEKTLKAAEPAASAPPWRHAPRCRRPSPAQRRPPADEAPPPAQAQAPARPRCRPCRCAHPAGRRPNPVPPRRPSMPPWPPRFAMRPTCPSRRPARSASNRRRPPWCQVPRAISARGGAKLVAAEAVTALTRAGLAGRAGGAHGRVLDAAGRKRIAGAVGRARAPAGRPGRGGPCGAVAGGAGRRQDCPARRNALAATQRQKAARRC
jgi:DNA polymerase-3 subunit gamma/tau